MLCTHNLIGVEKKYFLLQVDSFIIFFDILYGRFLSHYVDRRIILTMLLLQEIFEKGDNRNSNKKKKKKECGILT